MKLLNNPQNIRILKELIFQLKKTHFSTGQRTLIRVHLLPLRSRHVNKKDKISRNQHVRHLPKYQKITTEKINSLSTDTCSICQESLKIGEYYRSLPLCLHIFHKKCIDRWLQNDLEEMRCPLCRKSHRPHSRSTHSSYCINQLPSTYINQLNQQAI